MSELYKKAAEFRKQLLARDAAAADDLTEAYAQVWDRLSAQLATLEEEIAAARERGETISPGWLLRQERYRELIRQAEAELAEYGEFAGERVQQEQAAAIEAARSDAPALMEAAQADAPETVRAAVSFNQLPVGAVEDLVGFASNGTPLRKLFDGFGESASATIRRELTVGIATGRHPRQTARVIQGELGGDLVRARRIARTETLRAYRESTRRTYEANADVIQGWRWTAAKQRRTCPACLAMDGTIHLVTESLDGHPNCRCVMVPLTRYTRPRETGAEWLKRQPADVQRDILGAKGQKLFAAGEVQLADFVGRKESAEWGSMRHTHSLAAAQKAAQERKQSAGRGGSEPVPVSASLTFLHEDRFPISRRAIEAVDRVHSIAALPPVTVEVVPTLKGEGAYDREKRRIGISGTAKQPELSLLHEVAHPIDQVLGDGYEYGSVLDVPELQEWKAAVTQSAAFQRLMELQGKRSVEVEFEGDTFEYPLPTRYLEYLIKPQELWARSHSQYIAMKSGDPILQQQLDDLRHELDQSVSPTQWTEEDFRPIGDAIGRLLKRKGWLRE